jgi:hypothetical protein
VSDPAPLIIIISLGRDLPNPGMNPGMFFETCANFSFMYCLAVFSC